MKGKVVEIDCSNGINLTPRERMSKDQAAVFPQGDPQTP
jgi:hypothetical protein